MSDVGDLEAEVARRRAELAGTVDQLTERLSAAKATTLTRAAWVGGGAGVALIAYLVVRRLRS